MSTIDPADEALNLSDEEKHDLLDELKAIEIINKERCYQIDRMSDAVVNVTIDDKTEIDSRSQEELDFLIDDSPFDVMVLRVEKLFMEKPYDAIYTVGQLYQDLAYDPSISEAFDCGFLTAIKMIQRGILVVEPSASD